MRVAIIGHTSMLGSCLARRLRARPWNIVTAGRAADSAIALELTRAVELPPGIARIDTIVHCAASFAGDRLEDAILNEEVNALGALRVADFAERVGCGHLVYISSLSALEGLDDARLDSYGLSKRHAQENLAWACRRCGMGLTVLAPSQLYDASGEGRRHQPLLYHIVDCARRGADFTLFGTRDPLRNLLFVEDLAQITERVVADRIMGFFPVVHPESHRVSQIAEIAFRVFGRGGGVVVAPDRPDLQDLRIPEDTSLFERLDCWPETSLEHGLALLRDATDLGGGTPCTRS